MLLLPTALLALTIQTASAADEVRQDGNFGLGLSGGNFVSGIAGKYFLSDDMALEGVVGGGWQFAGFGASASLLWEMPNLAEDEAFDIAWNIGPGVGFWTFGYNGYPYDYTYNGIAISAVLGLEMDLNDVPLDIVLEWRPGVYVESGSSGVFDNRTYPYFGGLGLAVRYYF